MLPLIVVSIALVGIAFVLFSVRLLLKKGGEFRGTCAGNSPYLQKDGIKCGICGASPGETCGKDKDNKTISRSPA
jgi:hypothetical protein